MNWNWIVCSWSSFHLFSHFLSVNSIFSFLLSLAGLFVDSYISLPGCSKAPPKFLGLSIYSDQNYLQNKLDCELLFQCNILMTTLICLCFLSTTCLSTYSWTLSGTTDPQSHVPVISNTVKHGFRVDLKVKCVIYTPGQQIWWAKPKVGKYLVVF